MTTSPQAVAPRPSAVLNQPTCLAQSVDIHGDGNFPQGCSFSPDGLCIATATAADSKLRLYNTVANSDNDNNNIQPWTTALASTVIGETIRCYDWYPPMQSSHPITCCLIATGRDQPVQLIDAYTGTVRATYVPLNAMEEMESPTVVQFSPSGDQIVTAGYRSDRMMQLFDSARPGKDPCAVLKLGQTKRSSDGQKGLVSAVAFSGADTLAVGTYAPGSIYLYDFRQGSQQPSGTLWNGTCIVGHGKKHASKKRRHNDSFFSAAKTQWYAHRAQRGITQLQFDSGHKLYSASRNANAILVWDVRMLSGNPDYSHLPVRGYTNYPVHAQTNQRLQFALNEGRLWVGGLPTDASSDAMVRVYDTSAGASHNKLVQQVSIPNCAPGDAINGLSYNATYDMLAVATGSRRFPSEAAYDDEEDNNHQDTGKENIMPPGSLQLYKWNSPKKGGSDEKDGGDPVL